MATRCAIWARVSMDEQESGNQLAELRQLAAIRGFEVTAEYVLDGASAWKGEQREQLFHALDSARRGEYDVLLVWALVVCKTACLVFARLMLLRISLDVFGPGDRVQQQARTPWTRQHTGLPAERA
jgi:hypothetical protein